MRTVSTVFHLIIIIPDINNKIESVLFQRNDDLTHLLCYFFLLLFRSLTSQMPKYSFIRRNKKKDDDDERTDVLCFFLSFSSIRSQGICINQAWNNVQKLSLLSLQRLRLLLLRLWWSFIVITFILCFLFCVVVVVFSSLFFSLSHVNTDTHVPNVHRKLLWGSCNAAWCGEEREKKLKMCTPWVERENNAARLNITR